MRVLVTGGTGFIGAHTVAALLRAGHDVRMLVRSPDRIESALGPLGVKAPEHVVGDVTDIGSVEDATRGCDAVVHGAAVFTLERKRADEVGATNVAGAENVLGTAHRMGLDPIVFVSSLSALFPPSGPVLTPDCPVQEPSEPYARSKAESERVARRLQDEGAPVVCFYPGSVWGPHDPYVGEALRVVSQFMQMGFGPNPFSGGMPVVDVRDLAEAHVAALTPGLGPRRYLASGYLLPTDEMFDLFARLTGRRFLLLPTPGAFLRFMGKVVDRVQQITGLDLLLTHEAMHTLTMMVPGDDSRTEQELGVSFRSVEDTMRDTLVWLHERGLLNRKQMGTLAAE